LYSWRNACEVENSTRRSKSRPEHRCISDAEIAAKMSAVYANSPDVVRDAESPEFYLVLGWILIGIGYVLIRWIRAGFKRR
jgi:hypothetical protein